MEAFKQFGRRIFGKQFLRLFVLPALLFWPATLYFAHDTQEIVMLTLALVGASTAVCVAYGHYILTQTLDKDTLDSSDIIAVGIFYGFASYATRGIFSLTWRFFGEPAWMLNSDLVSGFLWAAVVAATLHLSAPHVINGRVPYKRWVLIGLWSGLAVMIGLVAMHYSEFGQMWQRESTPHDDAPAKTRFAPAVLRPGDPA